MSEFAICHYPYTSIQINDEGDVFFCCQPWCSSFSIGNIFKTSFSEIWNGEKAIEFRKQFFNDEYKYCKRNICINAPDRKFSKTVIVEKYPEVVALSYDRSCNVQCIFCRDCKISQDISLFEQKMEELLPEILKNAKRVSLSGVGEALSSKHTRKIMRKIIEIYPHIKFDILTNGLLMDEKNLSEIGIINNLGVIRFSIHSINEKTYNKLVKNSNLKKVLLNVNYIKSLREKGFVEQIDLRFVMTSLNYKEMVTFANMANEIGASASFLNLIKNEFFAYGQYEKINIANPNHPEYSKFIKTLKNPIFKEPYVFINQDLLNVQINSFFEQIKKKIF